MATENTPQQAESNKNITQVIYGLYAASLVVGVTYIVAIILNYVKRDDVMGTYLESHFRLADQDFLVQPAGLRHRRHHHHDHRSAS